MLAVNDVSRGYRAGIKATYSQPLEKRPLLKRAIDYPT